MSKVLVEQALKYYKVFPSESQQSMKICVLVFETGRGSNSTMLVCITFSIVEPATTKHYLLCTTSILF